MFNIILCHAYPWSSASSLNRWKREKENERLEESTGECTTHLKVIIISFLSLSITRHHCDGWLSFCLPLISCKQLSLSLSPLPRLPHIHQVSVSIGDHQRHRVITYDAIDQCAMFQSVNRLSPSSCRWWIILSLPFSYVIGDIIRWRENASRWFNKLKNWSQCVHVCDSLFLLTLMLCFFHFSSSVPQSGVFAYTSCYRSMFKVSTVVTGDSQYSSSRERERERERERRTRIH